MLLEMEKYDEDLEQGIENSALSISVEVMARISSEISAR